MGRILLGAILGLIVGAGLVYYFFVGAPRAVKKPGVAIQAPDPNGLPPGTATVTLDEAFFNTVLTTIFRDLNAPSFPLGLAENNPNQTSVPGALTFARQQPTEGCGKIAIKPEGSGVNTNVSFKNNEILAPLAFAGDAAVLGNCFPFTGWAEANLELRYDEPQQTVFGQINVRTVNLDGISPVVSGFVTPLVQNSLNQNVNPIQILRGEQLALSLPITSTNGTLNARVKDVRAETKNKALNLYVTYDFSGTRGGNPP